MIASLAFRYASLKKKRKRKNCCCCVLLLLLFFSLALLLQLCVIRFPIVAFCFIKFLSIALCYNFVSFDFLSLRFASVYDFYNSTLHTSLRSCLFIFIELHVLCPLFGVLFSLLLIACFWSVFGSCFPLFLALDFGHYNLGL